MNTIVKPIPHTVDLNEPVKKTYIDTLLATEDNLAHRFDITIKKGGEAVTLPDGAAVTAYFIRYGDNATVPITGGAVNGNVASVTLTNACYNKPGQFAIIIKVSGEGVIHTVFYGEGTVFASSTDKIVDEENVIPSLADLLARIAEMEEATEASKTATTNAKSATTKANNAATSANSAATAANTAAEAANAAAQNWGNSTAADSNKLGGKAPEYYLQPINLLDNSNFEIAQAGYGEMHGATKFAADRWECHVGLVVSKVSNGLEISSTREYDGMWQYLGIDVEKYSGKRMTAAMSVNGDVFAVTSTMGANQVNVAGNGATLILALAGTSPYVQVNVSRAAAVINWIALYEGSYTADTLPPYTPKGYTNELLACEVAEKGNIFGMDLLWENASPTSVFPQQAIAVNTTKYDGFLWQIKSWNGTSYISTWLVMDTKNEKNHTLYAISDKSLITRTINIRENQIYVYTGRNMDITTATYTEDDKYAIPVKLYGVRGVSV